MPTCAQCEDSRQLPHNVTKGISLDADPLYLRSEAISHLRFLSVAKRPQPNSNNVRLSFSVVKNPTYTASTVGARKWHHALRIVVA